MKYNSKYNHLETVKCYSFGEDFRISLFGGYWSNEKNIKWIA